MKILEEVESILEEFNEIKERLENHKMINIINSGLLKAGKSELFNALSNQENFETGVVRTTVENKEVKLENYVLIDTPGLDANYEDNKVAFEGYKKADIIIFVHNVIDGELNSIEIESIKNIIEIFGDKKVFFNSSVFVASHIDQLNNELEQEEILTLINNQIKGIFDEEFSHVIGVNSVGYIKGIKENKTLLKKSSNIDNLKNILLEMIKEEKSCFNYGIKNSINSINIKIDDKINTLEEIVNEEKVDFINIDQVKEDINSIRNDMLSKVEYTLPEYSYWFNTAKLTLEEIHHSHKHRSRYAAQSEWQEASKNIIEMFVIEGRQVGDKIVNYYEKNISDDGKLNQSLISSFNQIKEIYYNTLKNSQKDINLYNLEFPEVERDIDLGEVANEVCRELRQLDTEDFPSLNQYMSIQTIVEHKLTKFSKSKPFKDIKYYKWTIEDEKKYIIDEYKYVIRDKARRLYKKYEDPYRCHVTNSVNEFNRKVDLILDDIQDKVTDINNRRKEEIEFIQNINENIDVLKENKDCLSIYKEEIEKKIKAEKKLERERILLKEEYSNITLESEKEVKEALYKLQYEIKSNKYTLKKVKEEAERYREKFENALKQNERIILEQKNYYIMLNSKNLNDLNNKECIKKSIIELEEGINSGKYITQEAEDYLQKLKLKLMDIDKYEQNTKIKNNLEKKNKQVKKIEENTNGQSQKEDIIAASILASALLNESQDKDVIDNISKRKDNIVVSKNNNLNLNKDKGDKDLQEDKINNYMNNQTNDTKSNEIKNINTNKRKKPFIISTIIYFVLFYFGIMVASIAIDEKDISYLFTGGIISAIGLFVRYISMKNVDIDYYKQSKKNHKPSIIGIILRLFIGITFIWSGIDVNASMGVIIGVIIILYSIKSINHRIKYKSINMK